MTERKTRLARILEIIEEQDIGTQEDLAKALRREGFDVTQATVSRDIRQLRLEKSRTPDGGQKYIAPKDDAALLVGKFSRVMKDGLVSMDQAQNILVIKTVSGMLGHFSAGFTLDTYAHVTTSAKREAAKTMGNIDKVQ